MMMLQSRPSIQVYLLWWITAFPLFRKRPSVGTYKRVADDDDDDVVLQED